MDKTKNMVEGEFILLGTEVDDSGIPWALLASDRDGWLEFAGPAIRNPPQALRAAWRERMAELALTKPPLRGACGRVLLSGLGLSCGYG